MFARYDNTIRRNVAAHFPELLDMFGESGWLLIKAQIWQESSFDPTAESDANAKGLMQLLPNTAAYVGVEDVWDINQNIEGGIKYLAEQYRKLAEIPHKTDRLKAALASYNGGRGYINQALAAGRVREKQPESYYTWRKSGRPNGAWQTWEIIAALLPEIQVSNVTPDHQQMTDYVRHIFIKWERLLDA